MKELGKFAKGLLIFLGLFLLIILAADIADRLHAKGNDCTTYTCQDARDRNLNCSPGTDPCRQEEPEEDEPPVRVPCWKDCPVVACPEPEPEPDPVPMPPDPLIFAHFADGQLNRADVFVVNISATSVQPTVRFIDSLGSEIHVTEGPEIEPGEAWGVMTDGSLASTGSVEVESDGIISSYLTWHIESRGTATASPAKRAREILFPARPMTGLAIRNLAEADQVVTCDHGNQTAQMPVAVRGHRSRFMWEIFARPVMGLVRCTADGDFSAAVVDLNPGRFTGVPVAVVPVQQ